MTASSKMSNFYTRALTTFFIFPPVLYAVYAGGFLYFVLLFAIILLAGYEWSNICGKWSFGLDGMSLITVMMLSMTVFFMAKTLSSIVLGIGIMLLGTYLTYILAKIRSKSELAPVIPSYLNRPKWIGIGCLYLSLGFSSMAYVANVDYSGYTLIWVLLATVFNDVFAYIFGSIIGGKKIAPKVSPGKSWSGFVSAAISTAILGYLFSLFLNTNNGLFMIIFGAFMALFAHLGDMIESAFKRYINIKDTSNIIPGHGGVLDRIDAILMTAIFTAVISIILGKSPLFF
jgi:phosphatidate cytidylyltransferase